MSELIPFSSIEWGDTNYTEAQWEAAEFLQKMDWEGGIEGLLGYGGADVFPEDLRQSARYAEQSLESLRKDLADWAAERGVVY